MKLQLPSLHQASDPVRYKKIFDSTLLIPAHRPRNISALWRAISTLPCSQRKADLLPCQGLLGREVITADPIQSIDMNIKVGDWDDVCTSPPLAPSAEIETCRLLVNLSNYFQLLNVSNLVHVQFGFSFSGSMLQPATFRRAFRDVWFPKLQVFEAHNFSFDTSSITMFFSKHRHTLTDVVLTDMCCESGERWQDFLQQTRDLGIPWRSFVVIRGMMKSSRKSSFAWYDEDWNGQLKFGARPHSSMKEVVGGLRYEVEKGRLPHGCFYFV